MGSSGGYGGHVSQATTPTDPLQGWDFRRRAALEQVWEQFTRAGASGVSLSEELIAERRREAATEANNTPDPAKPASDRDTAP